MSRFLATLLLIFCTATSFAQKEPNVVLITMDGMRWQEIFNGADTSLLHNKKFFSRDSTYFQKKYVAATAEERRKKLMPFLWETIATKGCIYGNRKYDNFVNVRNRYWFSYPGYNEIFTGYPDTLVNSNEYPANPNESVFEFFNKRRPYEGNVASFASWDAFRRILSEDRSGIYVNDGFRNMPAENNITADLLNNMQHVLPADFGEEERLDAITGMMALEHMKNAHPKLLHISLGETDEFAHGEKYDFYLEAANHNDQIISMVWKLINEDPFYKNNTTLIIATDHGRGRDSLWTSHWSSVPNSDEIWFAAIGRKISAKGEIKTPMQLYQQQLAQTIAYLLGAEFKTDHPVANKIEELFK